MITNKSFIKIIIVLALCWASVSLTSCHHKDIEVNEPTPGENPQPEDSRCKPGDDFYTYANHEWLESVKDITSDEPMGWAFDISNESDENLDAIKDIMPEYEILGNDIEKCDENLEASTQLLTDIVMGMLGNIKSKEEAYVAFGQAIRLGITSVGSIYTGICREDGTIGFYFLPPVQASTSNAVLKGLAIDQSISAKKFVRYTPATRSEKTTLDYILEGIGLNPEFYLYNANTDLIVAALEKMSLNDLVQTISRCMQGELLVYFNDEYAQTCTDGQMDSVASVVKESIEGDLGYFTSYYFTNQYITNDRKDTFRTLSQDLIASFRNRLEKNTWLSTATQQAAIEKLDYMSMDFASPSKWPVTNMPELAGELLLEDILDIKECRYNVIETLMGKDIKENLPIFYMFFSPKQPLYPYICNAFYENETNAFQVCAPFMMSPAYSPDMEDVELYATLGVIIGHEITHGFDKEGATYNKYGEIHDWWSAEDIVKFEELNNRIIANVNNFEIMPGLKTNGAQTVMEDVADLGGFNIAYDLWVNKLKEQGVEGDELKEQKRKFFIYFAKMYRAKFPTDYILEEVVTDEHSIGHIRINSVVQQIDDWYELFNVTEGDALYIAPENRITIW